MVRTNSESVPSVLVPDDYPEDLTRRVSITSSIYPDEHTHIETVTYGHAADSMHAVTTLLVGEGTRLTRPLKWLAQVIRHPIRFWHTVWPVGSSRRTIIILVMQTLDSAIALRPQRRRFGRLRLQTEQDPDRPNPTFIPVANQAAEWIAKETGGIAAVGALRGAAQRPDDGAHHRRRHDRRRSRRAASSTPASASSATRTCSSATAPRCRRTSA